MEHIRKVYEWSRSTLCTTGKGDDHKGSRWHSFEAKSRRMIPTSRLLLIPLTWLGLRRGWWQRKTCPLAMRDCAEVQAIDTSDEALPGEGAEEPKAPEEALVAVDPVENPPEAHDGDGDPEGGPSTARVSVVTARAVAGARRKACSSTLMFAGALFCRTLGMRLWSILLTRRKRSNTFSTLSCFQF